MKLDESFYLRADVTLIAKELIGKVLVTKVGKQVRSGIIVETEAYSHTEKGCHAYMNKRTPRNEVMFNPGGYAYVYLCYGIHHLFNVVTGAEGVGDAVLVRALEPLHGTTAMMKNVGSNSIKRITSGPGKLTKALGIDRKFNGEHLTGSKVWIEGISSQVFHNQIVASKRIGIDYAGLDALLPWRFSLAGSPWVSR